MQDVQPSSHVARWGLDKATHVHLPGSDRVLLGSLARRSVTSLPMYGVLNAESRSFKRGGPADTLAISSPLRLSMN